MIKANFYLFILSLINNARNHFGNKFSQMKKVILLILCLLSVKPASSQTGWVSKFFNNVNSISKIIKRDNNNFIALCGTSKFFFKSSDAGNNWTSTPDFCFDSSYSLYNGQFINSQTGWVIGSEVNGNGVILKTTNGGNNWERQSTGFNIYHCFCICFLDENTGWIGSAGNAVGYLMKTTNGGINYTKQDFPGVLQIRSIKFFDNDNGWILGLYGLLSKTSDGGITWVSKAIPGYTQYDDLFAVDESEAWALINIVNSSMVYSRCFKTLDGGSNWNLMLNYTDGLTTNGHSFWKINFINSSTGFVNGEFNFIFKTTNSGVSWNKINMVSSVSFYTQISSILPISSNEIFAGGGYNGLGSYDPFSFILRSTDTGSNWVTNMSSQHYSFVDIHFKNIMNGLAVTNSGRIFKTIDNGSNWIQTLSNDSFNVSNFAFANDNEGNAFGSGKILKTTDYGSHWRVIQSPSDNIILNSRFLNNQTGFAFGNKATVLKSTDSGNNWNLIQVPLSDSFNFVSNSFINENTGWILARRMWVSFPPYSENYHTKIIKTTNAGENWTVNCYLIYSDIYSKINFFNNNDGWMTSSNKIFKTSNSGVSWQLFSSGIFYSINCIAMTDQNTGWIGGMHIVNGNLNGDVYKTTNGGLNWFVQFNKYGNYVRSMYFLNSTTGWFCGDKSSIYETTNGGNVGIINSVSDIPESFSLSQNYPNPFNPVTVIRYSIPSNIKDEMPNVKLIVYNVIGQEVSVLVNENQYAGSYSVNFNGSNLSSGLYFYKLTVGNYTETKRMILLK